VRCIQRVVNDRGFGMRRRYSKDLTERYELGEQMGKGACAFEYVDKFSSMYNPADSKVMTQGPSAWCTRRQTSRPAKGKCALISRQCEMYDRRSRRPLADTKIPCVWRRVAVKTMVKRYGGNGLLESNFIRRVQHEVSLQAARYWLYSSGISAVHVDSSHSAI